MDLKKAVIAVREKKPLIHHMTNLVVTNLTANFTLAMGALPIMAYDQSEVEEICGSADVLLLNIGTITEKTLESMLIAGEHARALGKRIILDPVGAAASGFRSRASFEILERMKPDVVKGNFAEIAALAGENAEMRGVESCVGTIEKSIEIAERLSKARGCVAAVSGREDVVCQGEKRARVWGGNEMLKSITGSGCMVSTAIACFLGVENPFEAAIHGFEIMKLCSEIRSPDGPASFQVSLLDCVYRFPDAETGRRSEIL